MSCTNLFKSDTFDLTLMKGMIKNFPVFKIKNFEDYNGCQHCDNSFYIREFDQHVVENQFLDKPHGHDFYILLLITQGSGLHHIDFKSYEVAPRTLFFIVPGQVHNWQLSADINGYVIFFTKEYLLTEFHANQLLKLPFFHTRMGEPYVQLSDESVTNCLELFRRIDRDYVNRDKFYQDLIRLNLKVLLLEIERKYQEGTVNGLNSYQSSQFARFEELVESHFKEHIPVSEYADRLHISVKQLNALCKKVLDKTPGDIIQTRIILEAKRLLIHSDYPVFSISETLNYTDHSYFIRVFKKATQLTPEQFRTRIALHSVA